MRSLPLALVVCALCTALSARTAHAIPWPSNAGVAVDPVANLRWSHVPVWVSPHNSGLRPALNALNAAPAEDAMWYARRALIFRLLDQEELCRTSLANAQRLQPDIAQSDTDVGLTQAWLLARAQDWSGAFDAAMIPLSRMAYNPSSNDREMLVLDVVHWSLARGPDGLAPALTLARQYLSLVPSGSASRVQTMLVLILARMNRLDEARGMARAVEALHPNLGSDNTPLGTGALVLGEGDAATGTALLLVGRGREAVAPLTRASTSVPQPWRAFTAAQLAQARRAPPAPRESNTPAYPLPNLNRIER